LGDIFREIDEDLRRDRFEKLWKRFGSYILAGAGLIVVATAGWVAWQEYQQRQNVETTAALHSALSAARTNNNDAAIAALTEISQSGTEGQAALAMLQEAALRAAQGDRDNARVLYRNIRENGSLAEPYRSLAVVRTVELDLDEGDPSELLQMLAALTDDANPWRLTAWELAAYLERRAGNVDGARQYLERIRNDGESSASARARAEAFLAQL
tara:strand:- start:514 stop:1152 length:639 start_codon:yes stop_codon:yes gene_type:complete